MRHINPELLTHARWFAGKNRKLTGLTPLERIAPATAAGAALELVEVAYADGGTERYALALRDGQECAGDDPLWSALAATAAPGVARTARGHLALDLSNTAVVLDGGVMLKLYRRLEDGPHPEAELLGALDGSPHAPRLLGTLRHDDTTLLVVQTLIDGTPVGWERLITHLVAGDLPDGEPWDLGHVTGRLHRVLAERLGTSHQAPTPPRDVALPAELDQLGPAVGDGLAPLANATAPVQRIHGDLHIGQFLRTSDRLVVVDWEGRPGRSLAERRLPSYALRDIASLRLSLAHAARAAHRRADSFDWRDWARRARAEALDGYVSAGGQVDRTLLHALELEQELGELEYAAQWLPEWLYAPLAVLPFVLEETP